MKLHPYTQANFDAIMDGLERHLSEYHKREVNMVPHPATWLNQRRWEGEA